MARNTYTLGGEVYTTQAAVRTRFKAIKEQTFDLIRAGDDGFAFLRDLYWRGPRPDTPPTGIGPVAFEFSHHDGWAPGDAVSRGVLIHLDDGSIWRFPSARYGYQTPDAELTDPRTFNARLLRMAKQKVSTAMRHMVRYQTLDFRERHATGLCELCFADGADVDHHPETFEQIRDRFLAGYSPAEIERIAGETIDEAGDGSSLQFGDFDLYARWCDYHMRYADFRLLCKPCHRRETQRQKDAVKEAA